MLKPVNNNNPQDIDLYTYFRKMGYTICYDFKNYNISKQADYFESERKITVYNARTDKVIMEAEGYMSISNNSNNELVCTVKVGPDSYRKNYIYLNDYTMYVVEDITGTHTDPYHYKLYFHTDILPSVEVKP